MQIGSQSVNVRFLLREVNIQYAVFAYRLRVPQQRVECHADGHGCLLLVDVRLVFLLGGINVDRVVHDMRILCKIECIFAAYGVGYEHCVAPLAVLHLAQCQCCRGEHVRLTAEEHGIEILLVQEQVQSDELVVSQRVCAGGQCHRLIHDHIHQHVRIVTAAAEEVERVVELAFRAVRQVALISDQHGVDSQIDELRLARLLFGHKQHVVTARRELNRRTIVRLCCAAHDDRVAHGVVTHLYRARLEVVRGVLTPVLLVGTYSEVARIIAACVAQVTLGGGQRTGCTAVVYCVRACLPRHCVGQQTQLYPIVGLVSHLVERDLDVSLTLTEVHHIRAELYRGNFFRLKAVRVFLRFGYILGIVLEVVRRNDVGVRHLVACGVYRAAQLACAVAVVCDCQTDSCIRLRVVPHVHRAAVRARLMDVTADITDRLFRSRERAYCRLLPRPYIKRHLIFARGRSGSHGNEVVRLINCHIFDRHPRCGEVECRCGVQYGNQQDECGQYESFHCSCAPCAL